MTPWSCCAPNVLGGHGSRRQDLGANSIGEVAVWTPQLHVEPCLESMHLTACASHDMADGLLVRRQCSGTSLWPGLVSTRATPIPSTLRSCPCHALKKRLFVTPAAWRRPWGPRSWQRSTAARPSLAAAWSAAHQVLSCPRPAAVHCSLFDSASTHMTRVHRVSSAGGCMIIRGNQRGFHGNGILPADQKQIQECQAHLAHIPDCPDRAAGGLRGAAGPAEPGQKPRPRPPSRRSSRDTVRRLSNLGPHPGQLQPILSGRPFLPGDPLAGLRLPPGKGLLVLQGCWLVRDVQTPAWLGTWHICHRCHASLCFRQTSLSGAVLVAAL